MAVLLLAGAHLKGINERQESPGTPLEGETSETDFELTSRQMNCSGQPQPLSGWVDFS